MTSVRLLMREPISKKAKDSKKFRKIYIHFLFTEPKRDFLRENKRQVKKIEEQFRETRIDDNKLELRNQRYANIQPKVQTRNSQLVCVCFYYVFFVHL
jgi:ribosomal protein L32E